MAGQFRCPGAGGALLPGGAALDGPRGWLGSPTVLGKDLEIWPQEENPSRAGALGRAGLGLAGWAAGVQGRSRQCCRDANSPWW